MEEETRNPQKPEDVGGTSEGAGQGIPDEDLSLEIEEHLNSELGLSGEEPEGPEEPEEPEDKEPEDESGDIEPPEEDLEIEEEPESDEDLVGLDLEGISDEERESPLYKKLQAHFTRVRQRDAEERKELRALRKILETDEDVREILRKKYLKPEEEEERIEEPDPQKFLEDPQGYVQSLVDTRVKKALKSVESVVEEMKRQAAMQKWAAEIEKIQAKYPDFRKNEAKIQAFLEKRPTVAQAVLSGEMSLEAVYRLVVGPTQRQRRRKPRLSAQVRTTTGTRGTKREPRTLEEAIRQAVEEELSKGG